MSCVQIEGPKERSAPSCGRFSIFDEEQEKKLIAVVGTL